MPRTVVVCSLLALLVVILLSSGPIASATGLPVPVGGLFNFASVQPNRTTYAGPCPVSIVFSLRATYNHPLTPSTYSYYWLRSDGTKSPVATIKVQSGQQFPPIPAADHWSVGAPGYEANVSDTLMINMGGQQFSMPSRKKVRVICHAN